MPPSLEQLPATLYRAFAQVGNALSNENRLRVLNLLAQGEMGVDEIAQRLGQSTPNTSIHLKVLREAHLIERRREGRRTLYRIADDSALSLWLALRDTGLSRIPEVRELMSRYAEEPDTLSFLDEEQLHQKAAGGDIVLVDLRSRREYEAGHLPHARSIPAAELEARIAELPADRTIVAYCRGPFCVTAIKSVARLRDAGLPVQRLREGVLEWKVAGRPLEGEFKNAG